jgi:hypothetical protein
VRYSSVVPLLTQAVQELNARTKYFEGFEEALAASSSSALLTDGSSKTFWKRLAELASAFADGVLHLGSAEIVYVKSETIDTKNINVDSTLCLHDTCITEEFRKVFGSGANDGPKELVKPPPRRQTLMLPPFPLTRKRRSLHPPRHLDCRVTLMGKGISTYPEARHHLPNHRQR